MQALSGSPRDALGCAPRPLRVAPPPASALCDAVAVAVAAAVTRRASGIARWFRGGVRLRGGLRFRGALRFLRLLVLVLGRPRGRSRGLGGGRGVEYLVWKVHRGRER